MGFSISGLFGMDRMSLRNMYDPRLRSVVQRDGKWKREREVNEREIEREKKRERDEGGREREERGGGDANPSRAETCETRSESLFHEFLFYSIFSKRILFSRTKKPANAEITARNLFPFVVSRPLLIQCEVQPLNTYILCNHVFRRSLVACGLPIASRRIVNW